MALMYCSTPANVLATSGGGYSIQGSLVLGRRFECDVLATNDGLGCSRRYGKKKSGTRCEAMRAIGTSSYGDAASLPPASVSIYKCWRIPPSKLAESTPLNGRSWVKICGSPDVSGLHKLKAWRRWPESDYPFRVNTVQLAVVVESCRNSADGAMLECGESGHIPDV